MCSIYPKPFGKICGRMKQERKTMGHLYFKTPFITEKLYQTHSYLLPDSWKNPFLRILVVKDSIYSVYALILVVFNCLFQKKERKKELWRVLIFANQSYQKYFVGTNFREFGSKNAKFAKFAKISTREN